LATSGKALLVGTLAAGFAAVSAAILKATSDAVEFENQLNEARKTADLTERQFNSLREGLLGIQAELGTSQKELAGIAAEAGRLGIQGVDDIEKFTRTVALMSEATVASSDQAAQGLARALNAFDLSVDKARNFGAVLNTLSNQTVANSSGLIDLSTRIGAAGESLGIAAEEAAAFGATLVDAGMSARRSGTRLRMMFTRISSRAEEVGKVMDMTGQEVVEAFEERGAGALREFLSTLDQMGQAEQAETIANIFGERNVQTIQTLVGSSENISKNLSAARSQMEDATSLSREMAVTLEDVSNEWGRLTAKLSAWVTDFGSNFTGMLESALSTLNDMLGSTDELIRDLESARRKSGTVSETRKLAEDLRSAEKGTEEYEKALSQLAESVPKAFLKINRAGEVVGVRMGAMTNHLEEMGKAAEEEVTGRMQNVIPRLDKAFQALQRKQAQVQAFEPGSDRWQEAREAVRDQREEVEKLLGAVGEELPEKVEEAREEFKSLVEESDLQAPQIGVESIRPEDGFDDIFQRLQRQRRSSGPGGTGSEDQGGGEDGPGGTHPDRAATLRRFPDWTRPFEVLSPGSNHPTAWRLTQV